MSQADLPFRKVSFRTQRDPGEEALGAAQARNGVPAPPRGAGRGKLRQSEKDADPGGLVRFLWMSLAAASRTVL